MDNNIPTPEERRRERMEQSEPMGANKVMRSIFGIIMIIVYVGMGVLLLINFFGWGGDLAWTRYFVGFVLIMF